MNNSTDPERYRADSLLDLRDELPAPRERSGIHPLSTAHLVVGVVFLAVAGVWALAAAGLVAGSDLRWLAPLPFVLGGAAGLVALGLTARRRGPASR